MTYCVGLCLAEGAVLLADTRTNAGVDNISTFSKMHVFETPGERVVAIMTAGNLAVTQAVIARVSESLHGPKDEPTIWNTPSMLETARLIGRAVRDVHDEDAKALEAQSISFEASFIIAGQIAGRRMRMFQVYSAGNFIEATPDTPYLQIGEHKYGKPILDRVARYETPIEDAVKLALVSMDSTLRSNLSVGLPIDLVTFRRDGIAVALRKRVTEDDAYFRMIRERWSDALRAAYRDIPAPPW
jgi:putative proteasome-type protease